MSSPLGYNPIGQSAPGLPRHDAPLPGHVAGAYTPIGGAVDYSSPSPVYRGGGFVAGSYGPPSAFTLWLARIFAFFATWITLPLAMTLYPLAGLVALAVGTASYFVVWNPALVLDPGSRTMIQSLLMLMSFLPAARLDIALAEKFTLYRYVRFAARLAIICGALYFSQAAEPKTAISTALIAAAIAFFILRAKALREIGHGFQRLLWLRKA
jgi:hypothetical protein